MAASRSLLSIALPLAALFLLTLSHLTTPTTATTPTTTAAAANTTHNWAGCDSFFLYALSQPDRLAHLAAMRDAGMKVVRVFLSAVGQGSKGSSARTIPDVEPKIVGVWDDSILESMDQLLAEAVQYGVKLDISMHDRYSLGCWAKDAYYYKYSYLFPDGTGNGTCNAQKNDVHSFYQNASIEAEFDNRLLHIIQHRNPLLGNRTWGELDDAIFTFAPQNEAQSFIPSRDWQWACRRAKTMRPHVVKGILMSTNGATVADSLQEELFQCPELDLMAVHNYGGGQAVAANYSRTARALADRYNKRTYVEEFGATGNNATKAAGLAAQIDGIESAHVPWMFWELVKGTQTDSYEVWTNSQSWEVLVNRSQKALADTEGAFAWPELFGGQKQQEEGDVAERQEKVKTAVY